MSEEVKYYIEVSSPSSDENYNISVSGPQTNVSQIVLKEEYSCFPVYGALDHLLEGSVNWNSVYASVTSTSSFWNSVYSYVNTTSALDFNIEQITTFVITNSANLLEVDTLVSLTSAQWNSVYAYVNYTSSIDFNWGDIHGDINDQIDLKNALDLKATTIDLTDHTTNSSNPHNVTKLQIGLGSSDNTSDISKPVSNLTLSALDLKSNIGHTHTENEITNLDKYTQSQTNTLLTGKISTSEKGANNGVSTLDSGGKVPASQLPSTVMEFKGTYDPNTNTPTLANGSGDIGDVYIAISGSHDFGAGSITFDDGDWVIYANSIWQKSINSNKVVSVNGQQGVVSLDTGDIVEGSNLYFTEGRVSANSNVSANTSARHSALSVTDSSEIDFALTGQNLSASLIAGSIDVLKLDSGVQTSLGKADNALLIGNNLSDVLDAGTAISNLGVDTLLDLKAPLADPDFTGEISADQVKINSTDFKLIFDYIDPPYISGVTLTTATTGGTITAGTYYTTVTFADANGYETEQSVTSNSVTTSGSTSTITVNDLPVSPNSNVTKRRIYFANTNINLQIKQDVNDNTSTSAVITSTTSGGINIWRGKTFSNVLGFGNTMGGHIFDENGDSILSVGKEGQVRFESLHGHLVVPNRNSTSDGSGGLIVFNTDDEESNVEYGAFEYVNDVLEIGHKGRGSFASREVRLVSFQPGVEFRASLQRGNSLAGWFNITDGGTSTPDINFVKYDPGVWTASYGTNRILNLTNSINMSGSSGYSIFEINVIENTTGSGEKTLANFKVGGSSKFTVDSSGNGYFAGNVGIGTTSPTATLEVYSTNDSVANFRGNDHSLVFIEGSGSSEKSLNFTTNGVNGLQWKVGLDNAPAQDAGKFSIKKTNNASAEFTIDTTGNVGIGTTTPGAKLQIDTGATGTIGQIIKGFSGQTANLQEWQNSSGTVLSVVNSVGNVGIGTTSPSSKLTVQGDTVLNSSKTLSLRDSDGFERFYVADDGTVLFQSGNKNAAYYMYWSPTIAGGAGGLSMSNCGIYLWGSGSKLTSINSPLYLNGSHTSGKAVYMYASSPSVPDMAVKDGSVGIGTGTTAPSAKLEVVGDALISGTVNGRNISTDGAKLDTRWGDEKLTQLHDVTSTYFSALNLNGGSSSTTFGNQLCGSTASTTTIDSVSVINHIGQSLNYMNTAMQGLAWRNPFTVIHTVAWLVVTSSTLVWMRLGSTSVYHVNPPPATPDYVSAGWVITESSTSLVKFKAYSYSAGVISYGDEITTFSFIVDGPLSFITTSDGTTVKVVVVNGSQVKSGVSQVSAPSESYSHSVASIGTINDGITGSAGNLRLTGSVKYGPIYIDV